MRGPFILAETPFSVAAPSIVASACSFVFISFLYAKLAKYKIGKDIGKPRIDELALEIKDGAIAFLKTEYSYLTVFVITLAGTLFFLFLQTADMITATAISTSFIFGATLSASAGWWGMMVATDGNSKKTVG